VPTPDSHRIATTTAALRAAITGVLAGTDSRALTAGVARLTESYHAPGDRQHVRSDTDAAAYVAARLPATYAALVAALGAAASLDPGFAPRTVLDLGAGTGAGGWAATATWPTLREFDLLDADERMLRLGRSLRAARSAGAEDPDAMPWRWQQGDLGAATVVPADVVIASYALGELSPAGRLAAALRAWESTAGLLVIVEPGTPAGFAVIRTLRDALIGAGASVLAPCPHDAGCPMTGADWCHFATRVQRSSLHRQVKGGERGHEDEKFSYVAVTRRPPLRAAGRLLRHPVKPPRRVELTVCAPGGLRRVTVGKSHPGYRDARDISWGDAVPAALLAPARQRSPGPAPSTPAEPGGSTGAPDAD
jgi:ribosomal protein RSM22 (predicted rRNA methylase)